MSASPLSSDDKKKHDLRNAILLVKQLGELLESGFEPTHDEREAIAKQLKNAYEVLKENMP